MPRSYDYSTALQKAYLETTPSAHKLNGFAMRLDQVDGIPEEAVAILRELFEELGRSARDREIR